MNNGKEKMVSVQESFVIGFKGFEILRKKFEESRRTEKASLTQLQKWLEKSINEDIRLEPIKTKLMKQVLMVINKGKVYSIEPSGPMHQISNNLNVRGYGRLEAINILGKYSSETRVTVTTNEVMEDIEKAFKAAASLQKSPNYFISENFDVYISIEGEAIGPIRSVEKTVSESFAENVKLVPDELKPRQDAHQGEHSGRDVQREKPQVSGSSEGDMNLIAEFFAGTLLTAAATLQIPAELVNQPISFPSDPVEEIVPSAPAEEELFDAYERASAPAEEELFDIYERASAPDEGMLETFEQTMAKLPSAPTEELVTAEEASVNVVQNIAARSGPISNANMLSNAGALVDSSASLGECDSKTETCVSNSNPFQSTKNKISQTIMKENKWDSSGKNVNPTAGETSTTDFKKGFDSSTTIGPITANKFQMADAAGYVYYIGEYFNATMVTNPNNYDGLTNGINFIGIVSLKNAKAIIANVDAYHLPIFVPTASITVPGHEIQTNVLIQAKLPIVALNNAGIQIGRTWVVCLLNAGSGWSTNLTANQNFLTEFLSYFPDTLGPQIGILTDKANFQGLFGKNYQPVDSNGNQVSLWWNNCDGNANTQGFVPFNGWNAPTQKRYVCEKTKIADIDGINGNEVVMF